MHTVVHESENINSDRNATRLLDQVRNAMRLRHMSRRTPKPPVFTGLLTFSAFTNKLRVIGSIR